MLEFPLDNSQPTICRYELINNSIHHIILVNEDNKFNARSCQAITAALLYAKQQFEKQYEEDSCSGSLIVSNQGKIFSNGMDVFAIFKDKSNLISIAYYQLLHTMLTFPLPTIALIHGHAFAGGLAFALCFDYRVMFKERGYLCMNEVDMPAAIPPGLMKLIKSKVEHPIALKKMILEGHRFTGQQALEYHFVDALADKQTIFDIGLKIAKQAGSKMEKSDMIYSHLRMELYADVVKALEKFDPGFLSWESVAKSKL